MMKKILILFILSAISLAAQVDLTKPPKPGPAPEIQTGKTESFKLENGLKVLVIENHNLPRVSFYLIFNRDPLMQGDEAGYITAVGKLLGLQTKTRTLSQINDTLDFLGAKLNAFSNGVFAVSLKENAPELMSLMSDIVMNSVFTQGELDNIKMQMTKELESEQENPQSIAGTVSDVLRFGKNFPYGVHPTVSTIKNITLKKCEEYYSDFFRPNIAYLAIVGDMTEGQAKPLVEKYFGSWKEAKVPHFTYKIPQPPDSTQVAFVDRPNSSQSYIDVTYPVILKPGSPDVIKAAVMNTILGGGALRLFKDLRLQHGYAYGAYSNLSQDEYVGNFEVTTTVRSQVTDSTVSRILYEMKKIRSEKVTPEELTEAKNYLSGNFALALEQPQTVAAFAINEDKYKLPAGYYKNYLIDISKVTREEVLEEAARYIKPDNSYIVVVGNADEVAKSLKQFGPVAFYDKNGDKIENTTAEITKGLTGEKVVENYIKAIGGKENIDRVFDRTTVMKGIVRGQEITMTIYQKAPDKMFQEIIAGPLKQFVYYDGHKGVMKVANKTLVVKGAELEKMKYESTLDLLTHTDSLGIKLKLEGYEKVNGKEAYKVDMIFPSGTKWIQYYDPDTWLKIKESKDISVPQGTFTQDTYLGDYRPVDGVKYPFSVKQSIGPQHLDFTVTSIKVNTGLKDSMFIIK